MLCTLPLPLKESVVSIHAETFDAELEIEVAPPPTEVMIVRIETDASIEIALVPPRS
jgi:hypothetical protein